MNLTTSFFSNTCYRKHHIAFKIASSLAWCNDVGCLPYTDQFTGGEGSSACCNSGSRTRSGCWSRYSITRRQWMVHLCVWCWRWAYCCIWCRNAYYMSCARNKLYCDSHSTKIILYPNVSTVVWCLHRWDAGCRCNSWSISCSSGRFTVLHAYSQRHRHSYIERQRSRCGWRREPRWFDGPDAVSRCKVVNTRFCTLGICLWKCKCLILLHVPDVLKYVAHGLIKVLWQSMTSDCRHMLQSRSLVLWWNQG